VAEFAARWLSSQGHRLETRLALRAGAEAARAPGAGRPAVRVGPPHRHPVADHRLRRAARAQHDGEPRAPDPGPVERGRGGPAPQQQPASARSAGSRCRGRGSWAAARPDRFAFAMRPTGRGEADAGARLIPGRRLALWLRSTADWPAVRGTVHEEAAEVSAGDGQGGARRCPAGISDPDFAAGSPSVPNCMIIRCDGAVGRGEGCAGAGRCSAVQVERLGGLRFGWFGAGCGRSRNSSGLASRNAPRGPCAEVTSWWPPWAGVTRGRVACAGGSSGRP
jgi:hypothetical protein